MLTALKVEYRRLKVGRLLLLLTLLQFIIAVCHCIADGIWWCSYSSAGCIGFFPDPYTDVIAATSAESLSHLTYPDILYAVNPLATFLFSPLSTALAVQHVSSVPFSTPTYALSFAHGRSRGQYLAARIALSCLFLIASYIVYSGIMFILVWRTTQTGITSYWIASFLLRLTLALLLLASYCCICVSVCSYFKGGPALLCAFVLITYYGLFLQRSTLNVVPTHISMLAQVCGLVPLDMPKIVSVCLFAIASSLAGIGFCAVSSRISMRFFH